MKRLALASALGLAVAGLFGASAASAATADSPLVISAAISNWCQFSANPTDLGDLAGSQSMLMPDAVAVWVSCNQGVAWSLDGDAGANFGVPSGDPRASLNASTWDGTSWRAMSNGDGTALLAYQLYSDELGTVVFGDVGGADAPITGVGTGDQVNVPLTVAVNQINLSPTGSYTDTVNLTLTY